MVERLSSFKLYFAVCYLVVALLTDAMAGEPIRVAYAWEDPAKENLSLLVEGDRIVDEDDRLKKLSKFDMPYFKRQATPKPEMSVSLQFVAKAEGDTANLAATMVAMVREANGVRMPYRVTLKSPTSEFATEIRTSRLPADVMELLINDQGCKLGDKSFSVDEVITRLKDGSEPFFGGSLKFVVELKFLKKPDAWRQIEKLLLQCNARHANGMPLYLYSFYIRE